MQSSLRITSSDQIPPGSRPSFLQRVGRTASVPYVYQTAPASMAQVKRDHENLMRATIQASASSTRIHGGAPYATANDGPYGYVPVAEDFEQADEPVQTYAIPTYAHPNFPSEAYAPFPHGGPSNRTFESAGPLAPGGIVQRPIRGDIVDGGAFPRNISQETNPFANHGDNAMLNHLYNTATDSLYRTTWSHSRAPAQAVYNVKSREAPSHFPSDRRSQPTAPTAPGLGAASLMGRTWPGANQLAPGRGYQTSNTASGTARSYYVGFDTQQRTLFVGCVNRSLTVEDLRDIFRRYGEVVDVVMPREWRESSLAHRGYAFIRSARKSEARTL